MRPLLVRGIAAIGAAFGLTGCDLALVGPLMPPILPGVGFPLTGTVVDAQTHLPVGGATVTSGLGSTITDATGHFSLYGGLGSHEVSVCRAGYTAVTDGDVNPNDPGDLEFALDPLFPDEGNLPTRFVELAGTVTNLDQAHPAQVFFGENPASVSNGTYDLLFKAAVPGKIYTSVLAWGNVSQAYNPDVAAGQPFNYTSFYYKVANWPMGDTIPQSKLNVPLPGPGETPVQVPIGSTSVNYKNLTGFAGVQTDILLDFGVVGSVPVARALGSNQTIPVPKVAGLKYDVVGTATDPSGKLVSTVQLTTNDPGQATFQLLGVPKITSPTNGASGVGQRPTFSWTPVGSDNVTYQVSLFEVGEVKPKWIGHTSVSEITYPGFSQSDINGGALRSDKKYTWTLTVLEPLGATQLPTSKAGGPVPVKPYRVRQREAENRDNGFSL